MRITSPAFRANVNAVHGDAGVGWLAEIPRLLGEIEGLWDVRIGPPYGLSYNYVAPATDSAGGACVAKLTVPGASQLRCEAAALARFDGRGAVRLLARDDSRGALLLERAQPGRELAELGPDRDSEATAILCIGDAAVMAEPPAGHGLRVVDYGVDFEAYGTRFPSEGPLPPRMVSQAAELLQQLAATATGAVLLHGDLHHHNILQAQREPWLAIDPHGLIGDRGFDIGAMLYNPMTFDADQLLQRLPAQMEQLSPT